MMISPGDRSRTQRSRRSSGLMATSSRSAVSPGTAGTNSVIWHARAMISACRIQ